MIIKLDLERLEWNFIKDTLEIIGLPSVLINLIAHYLQSASIRVNWNGTKTESFNSSRGLRQGNPISPYLFVLALERLGHKIQDLLDAGVWKPLKFGRGNGPNISHINFAYDLVLIVEASPDQEIVIQELLSDFYNKAGQKLNLNKCKVFFSKNIRHDFAFEICQILGIEMTEDLGIYLGAPLLHQRSSKHT